MPPFGTLNIALVLLLAAAADDTPAAAATGIDTDDAVSNETD
jgi:hypothetical protein